MAKGDVKQQKNVKKVAKKSLMEKRKEKEAKKKERG